MKPTEETHPISSNYEDSDQPPSSTARDTWNNPNSLTELRSNKNDLNKKSFLLGEWEWKYKSCIGTVKCCKVLQNAENFYDYKVLWNADKC